MPMDKCKEDCKHICMYCPRAYTHHTNSCDGEDYICGGCLLLGENGVDPRWVLGNKILDAESMQF